MTIAGRGAGGRAGCSLPLIFGNIDLLPIDNDSEKKNVSKHLITSNFSKTTDNVTLVHFM